MAIRITGMNSGLDTEGIIKQLVSAYSIKKDNYVKSQTKLTWKQDAWKSLNSKIYSLYTSISSLRSSSAYTLKKATVSDTTKASVTAKDSAVNGTYSLKVAQTAKSGYLTGGKLTSGTTSGSKLSDLGYSSDNGTGTISVTSGGKTTNIAVDENTTIKDFVSSLNSAGVKASYDSTNNRIYVAASDTGVANDFSITGSTASGTAALTAFGLNTASTANSATYSEWAAYAKNSEGADYFTFNNDGTVTTNGDYDAGKTQTALQEYLDAVAVAQDNNTALKAENNTSSATVSDYSKRIAYAQAYASTQNVLEKLDTDEERKDIQTLSNLSSVALKKSYETDADGNLQYDDDGKLIEATADSEYKVKGSDLLTELQTKAELIVPKTQTDDEGNETEVMDSSAATAFTNNLKTVASYESDLKAYTEAYASTQEVLENLDTDEERKDIQTLSNLSSLALKKSYETDENGNLKYDDDGKLIVATADSEYKVKGSDLLAELQTKAGLDSSAAAEFTNDVKTVTSYESNLEANEKKENFISEIQAAYGTDGIESIVAEDSEIVAAAKSSIAANNEEIAQNNAVISQHSLISNGEDAAALASRISYAAGIVDGTTQVTYSTGATRVNGQDALISLNGAEYTSSSNKFEINGLTIEALAETGNNEVTINVNNDTQGVYDKVKSFIKQYNELINEMSKLFNADSSKGYNPLTSEEKDAMSDTEIEEWEKKIKDSLLRRDDTLDGVMNVMKSAMSKSYVINGKTYSLSSFGISTLGILNAAANEGSAYHINGDSEDSLTSGKADKLMAAINDDPDSVTEFMKQLTSGLYDALDKKMKSTSLKSIYNVYNDKQMNKEYSNYTTTIKKWEEKITKMEDRYYKQFSAMETALAKLESSSSSLSSFFSS